MCELFSGYMHVVILQPSSIYMIVHTSTIHVHLRMCITSLLDALMNFCVCIYTQSKVKAKKAFSQLITKKKPSCLEQDLNPQSPAYQAGGLTTKPPRQLSSLGRNLKYMKQCNYM